MISQAQIQTGLENIYLSPLEDCNLNCRLCYTKKTKSILANKEILDFLGNYKKVVNLKSVIFCGGEVFTLPNISELINKLARMKLPDLMVGVSSPLASSGAKSLRSESSSLLPTGLRPGFSRRGIKVFTSIITNGTIDRLAEIKDPQNCQLLVSLDGPEKVHDANRGKGNFQKSLAFINKAISFSFPIGILFLVTPESYPYKDSFPKSLSGLFSPCPSCSSDSSCSPRLTYLTQKTSFFTQNHPLTNNQNSSGLTPKQIINIKKNYPSIPSKNFGCMQLSLQSNGFIYGCCESPTPIGKMSDPIEKIIDKFKTTLEVCQKCGQCKGCCNPEFLCGYIKELGVKNCQEVVKLLA